MNYNMKPFVRQFYCPFSYSLSQKKEVEIKEKGTYLICLEYMVHTVLYNTKN